MKRLTVREACAELECSRWTLDRLFKAGKLAKFTAPNGRVSVDAAQLRAYIRRHGTVGNATNTGQFSAEDIAALKALAEIGKQLVDAQRQVA